MSSLVRCRLVGDSEPAREGRSLCTSHGRPAGDSHVREGAAMKQGGLPFQQARYGSRVHESAAELYKLGGFRSDGALLIRTQRAWDGGMPEDTPCGNGSLMGNTANIRAPHVWSKWSRLKDAISVSLCGAAALAVLATLVPSLAVAEQRYEPPISYEREVETFIVNADGSFREISQTTLRIETPAAIVSEGAQRVAYASSCETIEAIEAWIIQPDGTKITVSPESIHSQDEGTEGGTSEFSDTKYKVIVFPQVRVGSRLYWRETLLHTPEFGGQFSLDRNLSPRWKRERWVLDIILPAGKVIYIEKRGVEVSVRSWPHRNA